MNKARLQIFSCLDLLCKSDRLKTSIRHLAIEISDTTEYNSYKHALRSVSDIIEFAVANRDTLEIVQSFDTRNSMTYFQEYKDGRFSYETKALDTERDFRMTLLASEFIYNIIMFRRASLVRDLPGIPVAYFSKEVIDKSLERGTNAITFSSAFTPVKP